MMREKIEYKDFVIEKIKKGRYMITQDCFIRGFGSLIQCKKYIDRTLRLKINLEGLTFQYKSRGKK